MRQRWVCVVALWIAVVGMPSLSFLPMDAAGAAPVTSCTPSLIHQFDGPTTDYFFGAAIGGAGDVNGDGYADLIVGSQYASHSGGFEAGRAWVYSGQTGGQLWQFDGQHTQDWFGYKVDGAGDVNRDGFDDVVISAYLADPDGKNGAGSVFVYSGQTGSPLWQFDGDTAGTGLGYSVAGAGDVDNDGYDDVVCGAWIADPDGIENAGSVFVYSGQTGDLIWRFDGGTAYKRLGVSVSGAGDVDADGYGDLVTGTPYSDPTGVSDTGSVIVYSGRTGSVLWEFKSDTVRDFFGLDCAGVGDVDGDGFDDVAVGAYKASPNADSAAGSVYVYSGQTGTLLWQFDGDAATDLFGCAVDGAGDVDADGFADIVVGAYAADPAGVNDAGSAYVYSGLTGALLWRIDGAAADDRFGSMVSGAGDVDSDGVDDIFAGAPYADPGGLNRAGSATVFGCEDIDGDGEPNGSDNCVGVANASQDDSDGDGVGDACDICPGFDDAIDSDNDGVPDGCDVCAVGNDNIDSDGDSVPDGCDVCAGFNDHADSDNDNVPDGCDICPGFDDLADADSDGVPDGCDICAGFDDNVDSDFDGVPDGCDICPGSDDLIDTDGDTVPDGCDICAGFNDLVDADLDGIPDSCDNCPSVSNPFQDDADSNGIGDACDCACPYQCNFDDNAVLDAVDLNAEIQALFFNGPDPQDPQCPRTRGDFNADGASDSVDLNALIQHLFFNGPPPSNPCS